MTPRVLVTGAAGQLGHELQRSVPADVTLIAVDRAQLDLADTDAVERVVAATAPRWIVNAAAYTAVDRAEADATAARSVNVDAVSALARSASRHGARLLHVSTDFVFGGVAAGPWTPQDAAAPVSVYGQTKLDGERAVQAILADEALIIRTAWLYSAHGTNFVKTMLRLMRERDAVRVIADQIGTPTWGQSLAQTIWAALRAPDARGILHWTDAGAASWYDFAVAIQEEALALGLLTKAVPVHPIPTAEYPTPARRPAYSVLDTSRTVRMLDVTPVHWRSNLRLMLRELANA